MYAAYSAVSTVLLILTFIVLIGLLLLVLVQMRNGRARTMAAAGLGVLLARQLWSLAFSSFIHRTSNSTLITNSVISTLLSLGAAVLLVLAVVQTMPKRTSPAVSPVQQPYVRPQPMPAAQNIMGAPGPSQQYGQQTTLQPYGQAPTPQQPYGQAPQTAAPQQYSGQQPGPQQYSWPQQTTAPQQYGQAPRTGTPQQPYGQPAPQPGPQQPHPGQQTPGFPGQQPPGQDAWTSPRNPYERPQG